MGVLVTSRDDSDVWIFEPGKRPRQVTNDGNSVAAAWSPTGEVLVGRALEDGRYVVVRYDRLGRSRQLTEGPSDCLPSFSLDGSEWLYADYQTRAVMRCKDTQCVELVRDPQYPEWPVFAPDGQHVAYTTTYGTPRIVVVTVNGQQRRDLGPTTTECPPVWTSSTALWTFSGAGSLREWDEIDINTGARTGRSKQATTFNRDKQTCGWENEPASSPFYRHARVIRRETWDVSLMSPELAEVN